MYAIFHKRKIFISYSSKCIILFQVPANWRNPTGQYHIGVQNLYSLYPGKLKERVLLERKKRLWDSCQKTALAEASRELQVNNHINYIFTFLFDITYTRNKLI